MGISFEVTTHPQFTVEELALQLAESLQGTFNAQKDITVFNDQVVTERGKIQELQTLLKKVETFNESPPVKISRMEPLASYSLNALKEEVSLAKERTAEWQSLIIGATDKVSKLQKRTMEIQREITERSISKR